MNFDGTNNQDLGRQRALKIVIGALGILVTAAAIIWAARKANEQ